MKLDKYQELCLETLEKLNSVPQAWSEYWVTTPGIGKWEREDWETKKKVEILKEAFQKAANLPQPITKDSIKTELQNLGVEVAGKKNDLQKWTVSDLGTDLAKELSFDFPKINTKP